MISAGVPQTADDWLGYAQQSGLAGDLTGSLYGLRRALALDGSDPNVHMSIIYHLDLHPHASTAVRRAARARFDREHIQPLMARARPSFGNDPDPHRKLRVGYVSSDFFACSAAFCHGALILGSVHEQADLFVYATRNDKAGPDDEVETVFRNATDVWRDVTGVSDERLAEMIRADRIDVLVDLGGYSSGGRMLVFARRPAPVQITGWGHATGTDLSCFDYTVGDAVTTPPDREHLHREAVLRVPSIITYVPSGDYPITYEPPTDRPLTFGYLGRPEKLSPACLGAWADILHRLPESRLLLKAGAWEEPAGRAFVLIPLGALGIGSDRILFEPATINWTHLTAYNRVDVQMDPFPHGGGVTMGDACWMGVPSVTLMGDTIPGRVPASLLTTLGHTNRIAYSVDEYVRIALRLARTPQYPEYRLAARASMAQSVLVDAGRYASAVEGGYRQAWARWCDTQTRQLIAV